MAAAAVPPLVARVAVTGSAVAGGAIAGGAIAGVVAELALVLAPWWPVATTAGVALLALQAGGRDPAQRRLRHSVAL